jgi:hypothetical protein
MPTPSIARRAAASFAAVVVCLSTALMAAAPAGEFSNPRVVEIVGYQDHAMEPFISRNGATCCSTIAMIQARIPICTGRNASTI